MYGQTNCWALPEGDYAAFRGLNGEIYIMTERSALNLSYQVPCSMSGFGWVGRGRGRGEAGHGVVGPACLVCK